VLAWCLLVRDRDVGLGARRWRPAGSAALSLCVVLRSLVVLVGTSGGSWPSGLVLLRGGVALA